MGCPRAVTEHRGGGPQPSKGGAAGIEGTVTFCLEIGLIQILIQVLLCLSVPLCLMGVTALSLGAGMASEQAALGRAAAARQATEDGWTYY